MEKIVGAKQISKKLSVLKDICREASLLQFNELVKTTRPHNPSWFLDCTSLQYFPHKIHKAKHLKRIIKEIGGLLFCFGLIRTDP